MTMKVRVIAPFEVLRQDPDETVEVPDGIRVRDLLKNYTRVPIFARILPVSVNGIVVKSSHRLADGDTVIFMMPITGG